LPSTAPASSSNLNVISYGADPSFAADSTAAFNAAIAACGALGGVVYVPTGKYLLSVALALPANVSMRGDGLSLSILHWASATDGLDLHSVENVMSGQEIRDLWLQASGKGLDGLSIVNRNQCRVDRVSFSGWQQRGAYWNNAYSCEQTGCFLTANGSQAPGVSISAAPLSTSPTILTVTTTASFNPKGGTILVSGATGNVGINGNWLATVIDATHVSIPVDTHLGSAFAGPATAQHIGYAQVEFDTCGAVFYGYTNISNKNTTTPAGLRVDRTSSFTGLGGVIESTGIGLQIASKYENSSPCYLIGFTGTDFEGPGDHYVDVGYGWQGAGLGVHAVEFIRCGLAVGKNLFGFKFANTEAAYVDRCSIQTAIPCAIWFEGSNNANQRLGVNVTQTAAFPYCMVDGKAVAAGWGMPWSYTGAQPQLYSGYEQAPGMPPGATPNCSTVTGPVGCWTTSNASTTTVTNITGAGGLPGQFLFILNGDAGKTSIANAATGAGRIYTKTGGTVNITGNMGVLLVTDGSGYNWIQIA
jgi:hypothetical protein